MSIQLGLNLQSSNPLSERYLVVHSGIIKAVDSIRLALKDSGSFSHICVYGEKGSGKTHLLNVAKYEAAELENFSIFEFGLDYESLTPSYVAAYEKAKIEGGLILLSFEKHPDFIDNPHLRSRVLTSLIFELQKPKESELRDILSSLMERNNFNLGERAINYIISRVPSTPLSFAAISDKLQETFREQGKSAKFSVVKNLIG